MTSTTYENEFPVYQEEQLLIKLREYPAAVQEAARAYCREPGVESFHRLLVEILLDQAFSRDLPEKITGSTRLSHDMGMDSMATMEAIFQLEELFEIPVELRELRTVVTVGELGSYLLNQVSTEAQNQREGGVEA